MILIGAINNHSSWIFLSLAVFSVLMVGRLSSCYCFAECSSVVHYLSSLLLNAQPFAAITKGNKYYVNWEDFFNKQIKYFFCWLFLSYWSLISWCRTWKEKFFEKLNKTHVCAGKRGHTQPIRRKSATLCKQNYLKVRQKR